MQLKDVMTTHVRGISTHQSVREAAEVMGRMRVGSLPVFRDGQPVGIVTDRDITVRAVACGCDCSQVPVEQIMSDNLCTLPERTSIENAAEEMEQRQIRRVLVTGQDNAIVGIVSLGDIAAKSHQQRLSAELIERVSQPCQPILE
jgi:CBS domain-containing protein